ncbi:MAG: exodeoxyribonuclease V subunit gamma [Elusimicrobiaceae bacterium]|nr:exodeoxyribonuclease V subunit gamma [Elusimicrobiaceae bacterium]
MELIYAHYPSLEKSFLQLAGQRRRLEPWLVVCASRAIAQRLREELARQQGIVANVHFCTGSSLLYKLDSEAGPAAPLFPQDHLRDFLLKDILSEPGLDRYPVSRGLVSALKEALRDLADSLVPAEVLEEHLLTLPQEEFAPERERFAWLVQVYKRYVQREAELPGYRPYQALFERALQQAESSDYLKNFTKIIFYGFYDMPGRQLELFNQLRRHYAVTTFAPYVKYPAYQFARKFFETNYVGSASPLTDANADDSGALGAAAPWLFAPQGDAPAAGVRLVSAATTQSEVFFVAKEILRLMEEEGYNPADIGVIARTQGPYQTLARRIFAQNKIALNASFSHPLDKFPLGVFCLNLLMLEQNGFDRQSVLSVLSSPYFQSSKKQVWRMLAEKSLVSLHLSQWRDLLPLTDGFDPEFLTWLEACHRQLQFLQQPGLWADKCARAQQFLAENIDLSSLQGKEVEIYQRISACVASLAQYRVVRDACLPGEFIRELVDALSSLCFNEVESVAGGVTFTDALRARGLRFRAVFLLGINEKVFPQLLPEDPIFRDRYRYIVRDVLGYWVSQKSERTQEERLLFFTACSAARERLYVSYACRGTDGKETVPSVYVAELARATRQTWNAADKPLVSAHLAGQLSGLNPLLLTPKETSCMVMLHGKDVPENYRKAGLYTSAISRSVRAAASLKQTGQIGAFDGFIQSGEVIFQASQQEGFSPSALQDLAACPMKYFLRKGLHLADKEQTYSRGEWAADKRGSAYHKVLEEFYKQVRRLGGVHNLFGTGITEYVNHALDKHYTLQSYRDFGIYPVVWGMILNDMRAKLQAFVTADVAALGEFVPSYFEREFSALQVPDLPFHLRGIIDRIDTNAHAKTFQVVDYKSSRKGTGDLVKSFFTHLIFQPFLYALAAGKLPDLNGWSVQGACLLSINKGYDKRELTAEQLEVLRVRANQFLTQLAQLVRTGKFFLSPSDLCTYCPYSSLCRKDSYACLLRARKSEAYQQLEEARYGV